MRNLTGSDGTPRAPRRSEVAGPLAVPRLEELASDPQKVWSLDVHTARVLTSKALVALNALNSRQLELFDPATYERVKRHSPEEQHWLTDGQAAEILHKNRRWVRRHFKSLPFVRYLNRKTMLISEPELNRWISAHKP